MKKLTKTEIKTLIQALKEKLNSAENSIKIDYVIGYGGHEDDLLELISKARGVADDQLRDLVKDAKEMVERLEYLHIEFDPECRRRI